MKSFEELKLTKPILRALEEAGFERPTPIQERIYPVARSGQDIIGIAQTGTGKTLAYLIPILIKLHYAQGQHPRALVIVPTRELVVQVCESVELLNEFGDIRCCGIYGGTNLRTQQAQVSEGCDLLVATPGRFMDIYFNRVLRTRDIKMVVVDEADRMLDLGFMPQLRSIMEVLPKHQTILFSATFSNDVAKLADEFLVNPARIEVTPQATTVDEIAQYRYDVPNIMTKVNMLKGLLEDREIFRRVMIFTESKKNADRITDQLAEFWGDELSVIHSNKAQNTRLNALRAFKEGRSRILVASDVAARGIDVEDISHVINFDIPSEPEEYVHRIGRTGRAGKEGVAISFVGEKEIPRFEAIERLIGMEVERLEIPENIKISDILLDEERVETQNIAYDNSGIRKGGGAFKAKSAKNSKTPQKSRLDRTREGRLKKRK